MELALQAGIAKDAIAKVPCTLFRIPRVLTAEDASPCAAVSPPQHRLLRESQFHERIASGTWLRIPYTRTPRYIRVQREI